MARFSSISCAIIIELTIVLCSCVNGGSICRGAITTEGSIYERVDMTSTFYYVAYEDYSFGSLTINGGSILSKDWGYICKGTETTGTVTVTGSGSQWINDYDLSIGDSDILSNGTLLVEAGGQVWNRNGDIAHGPCSGKVTVTGTGSTWNNRAYLYVGKYGDGEMIVESGGQVITSLGDSYLGYSQSWGVSKGKVTVNGMGSKWTNGNNLYVGYYGNGTLTVNNGGVVTAKTLYASPDNLLGNGTITTKGIVSDMDLVFDSTHGSSQSISFGAGGTINLTMRDGDLGVGYKGNGTLRIADGVTANSANGYLGFHSDAIGTVTVTGFGTTWNNDTHLRVGYKGEGSLTIEAGGQVTSVGCSLGDSLNSKGKLMVTGNGSTFACEGLVLGYYGDSESRIEAGGQVINTGNCRISCNGGTSSMTVTGANSKFINDGTLYVGNAKEGTLIIEAGGQVSNNMFSRIASVLFSKGTVVVKGNGSKWINGHNLYVGMEGAGELDIINSGFVSVAGTLTIDFDENDDSFVKMASGGRLALYGDADESIAAFLDLVEGTDEIRYWDDTISDWAHISGATEGGDYTLEYISGGDLDGYTVLTVTAMPEPATLGLLCLGGLAILRRRSRKA
ncbi:MAG: PEP-CTERM sorting domain-containing protein [Phycisphaerae bacterium]|nr:PEP-CTERM sorting domain-containing protein [Phycisphaerae bacterium]